MSRPKGVVTTRSRQPVRRYRFGRRLRRSVLRRLKVRRVCLFTALWHTVETLVSETVRRTGEAERNDVSGTHADDAQLARWDPSATTTASPAGTATRTPTPHRSPPNAGIR
jgi:hypothetical protein